MFPCCPLASTFAWLVVMVASGLLLVGTLSWIRPADTPTTSPTPPVGHVANPK